MYSATFAITVIFGIAAVNLFLGFAVAVLLGRGPKSWDDLEQTIVVHPVTIRGLRFAPRPQVERIDLPASFATAVMTPAASPGSTAWDSQLSTNADEEPAGASSSDSESAGSHSEAPAEPKKLVLAAKPPVDTYENDPPEQLLERQINAWRDGDLSEETPSMSGLRVAIQGDVDQTLSGALIDAMRGQIKSQLRRDRRVLQIAPDTFAWFSADVTPVDALLPVERIRQIIAATHFRHAGGDVRVQLAGGVVHGTSGDDPGRLLNRLHSTLQYALEKDEFSTCIDEGAGPEGVSPFQIEVAESVCELEC